MSWSDIIPPGVLKTKSYGQYPQKPQNPPNETSERVFVDIVDKKPEIKNKSTDLHVPRFCKWKECPCFLVEDLPGWSNLSDQVEWTPQACCFWRGTLYVLSHQKKCLALQEKGNETQFI